MARTVAIVCGAGVSSTFLARAVRDLVRERSLDWTVEALAEDQLADRARELELVLLGHHMSGRLDTVSALVGDVPVSLLSHSDPLAAARDAVVLLTSAPLTSSHQSEGLSHG